MNWERIKRALRWFLRVSLALLAILLTALLLKDTIIKSFAERRLRRRTGLEVRVGQLQVGLLSQSVALNNLTVFNPPGFSGAILLRIPTVSCVLDLRQARTNRLHFKELKLSLAELNIIKNKHGLLNLELARESMLTQIPVDPNKRKKWVFRFGGIERLDLSLEKVNYLDEQQPRNSRHFDLGVDHEIVTGLQTEEDFNRWLTGFVLRLAFQEYLKDHKENGVPPSKHAE